MVGYERYQLSDFTILGKLGMGGFGSSYRARRRSDGLEVCLKVVPLNKGRSEETIEQETKMLSSLKDDHIINCYGSFVEYGAFYIVTEYATEGSLAELIEVGYLFIVIYIVIVFMYLLY